MAPPRRHQIADWPQTPSWVQQALDSVLAGDERKRDLPTQPQLLAEGFEFVRPLFECFRTSRLLQREDFLALFLTCDTLCEHGCGYELRERVSSCISDAMGRCVTAVNLSQDDRSLAHDLVMRWRQLAPWVGVWAAACHSLDARLGSEAAPIASADDLLPMGCGVPEQDPKALHVAKVAHSAFSAALARTLSLVRLRDLSVIVGQQCDGLLSAVTAAIALRRSWAAARIQRIRTVAPLVGRIRRFMMLLHDSIHYRPGGVGQKRCRDDFEFHAKWAQCDLLEGSCLHQTKRVATIVSV